jgi:hypothetical protein
MQSVQCKMKCAESRILQFEFCICALCIEYFVRSFVSLAPRSMPLPAYA